MFKTYLFLLLGAQTKPELITYLRRLKEKKFLKTELI